MVDYADGWIPLPAFHDDLNADVADLQVRLRAAGRDPETVPISLFDEFETSEDDLRKFADYSFVKRSVTRCPTEDKDTVLRWLDKYAEIGQRLVEALAG